MEALRRSLRFNLGEHRKTRLKKATGGRSRTLLDRGVAEKHAIKLKNSYEKHCNLSDFNTNRLKYLTILHELLELDIEQALDSAKRMKQAVEEIFDDCDLWALGVIEVELVNIELLEKIQAQDDNEKRKLAVLKSLAPKMELAGLNIPDTSGTKALIHSHILVDLGKSIEQQETRLRDELAERWNKAYQVELSGTYTNKTLKQNLTGIATYATKGGNEQLKYKTGIRRDLGEDLEAKIWRGGSGRKDQGNETVENERGLTIGEVGFLDALYDRLMSLRKDRRGYLISSTNNRRYRKG